MARKSKETDVTERTDATEPEATYTHDSDTEGMQLTEDDFTEELWPAGRNIHVYITDPKIATSDKPGSKIFGKQYITGELTVADYQSDPEIEEYAGETMDFFFAKGAKRDRKKLQALLVSVFGEIPRHFTADQLTNQPLVITVTHGKPRKDEETGDMVTPMYLDKIRPDRTVAE